MHTHTVMTHAPAQSDAEWLAAPCVLAQGVSLAKITDGVPTPVAPVAPVAPIRGSWLLGRNDLDLFSDWIALTCARARRLGHL